jgi:5-(carboxyamino)imidazole ribonucleotide synthase
VKPVEPLRALPPGSVIGVIGDGQLGRMLALAAARLGLRTAVLGRPGSPAAQVCDLLIEGREDDPEAIARLARAADVLTFEWENAPADAIEAMAGEVRIAPGARALRVSQDRLHEKSFLNDNGAPTVPFVAVDGPDDIVAGLELLGAPAVLKTRRFGYDGKGQTWIAAAEDAEAAFHRIGARPAVLEQRCDFVREVSVVAARGLDGSFAAFPLSENHHEGGVLRRSIAPAAASAQTADEAQAIARRIAEALDYVGVLAVEFFELEGGVLRVNEIAPRVHNSGHWTLDACEVDQFEQHIRAVAGWPLGPTTLLAAAEMQNLLGYEAEAWAELAADPSARLWLYGKAEAQPGRKMGHVTRLRPLPAA